MRALWYDKDIEPADRAASSYSCIEEIQNCDGPVTREFCVLRSEKVSSSHNIPIHVAFENLAALGGFLCNALAVFVAACEMPSSQQRFPMVLATSAASSLKIGQHARIPRSLSSLLGKADVASKSDSLPVETFQASCSDVVIKT